MQKGTFDRKAMEFFSFKFTDHKTLLVCVAQEDQHIFKFNRTFCVYRLNVSTICHISERKYLIAKIKHKFCESSVTDGWLPFYCGWIRVWLLKPLLHEWGVYVFRSVCGIFTHQPNPAAVMTTKGLCLQWIWNFMIWRLIIWKIRSQPTKLIWFLLDIPLEFPLSSLFHVFFMLWNECGPVLMPSFLDINADQTVSKSWWCIKVAH